MGFGSRILTKLFLMFVWAKTRVYRRVLECNSYGNTYWNTSRNPYGFFSSFHEKNFPTEICTVKHTAILAEICPEIHTEIRTDFDVLFQQRSSLSGFRTENHTKIHTEISTAFSMDFRVCVYVWIKYFLFQWFFMKIGMQGFLGSLITNPASEFEIQYRASKTVHMKFERTLDFDRN